MLTGPVNPLGWFPHAGFGMRLKARLTSPHFPPGECEFVIRSTLDLSIVKDT